MFSKSYLSTIDLGKYYDNISNAHMVNLSEALL